MYLLLFLIFIFVVNDIICVRKKLSNIMSM